MKTTPSLFLTNILCLVTLVLSELCHPQDKKVLLQIKNSFNNPRLYSSWNPNTDCCVWKWVGCDQKTNRIFDFYIYATHETLSGPIPPEIGDLPYLESIEINSQPYLTGPIPHSLTKLKKLSYFSISQSGISGPIPGFLSEIKTLTGIVLHTNNLTGPIPSSLSQLPNLDLLDLMRNRLGGPIPRSLSRLKNLVSLDLSRNRLSGKVPAWLGSRNFTHLDLSRNKLEGDASTLFEESTKTAETVDLSRNSLEFNFTKVKHFPKGVIFLDISDNIFHWS